MSAFSIPWGTEVRVKRAPEGVMLLASQGILVDPKVFSLGFGFESLRSSARDPDVIALLKVDSIHWSVRANGWEFEVVDKPAVVHDDWEGFAARCRARIDAIVQSKDDGMFAKLYAQDVGRLLAMLHRIDEDGDITGVTRAFELTK